MAEISININSKELNYPIFVDNEEIEYIKTKIKTFIGSKKYVVIFSEKVYKLYGKILDFGKSSILVIKDGEQNKNLKNLQKIMKFLFENDLTRHDYVIALGGGVIGDMVGLASSLYMRGIHLIQIPTTLLSMVDSCVGGKTAIDTKYGKNLIGTFYQPDCVIVNTNFIKTLDEKQYKSGLGEVLKYGFIEKSCENDEVFSLLNLLYEKSVEILNRENDILCDIIIKCIKLKKSVVEKDEKESGLRRVLNFGHTYGHAIETLTKYNKYTHGQAVVEGILFAFKISDADESYKFFAKDLIEKYGFIRLKEYPFEKIYSIMLKDKKVVDGKVAFVLPTTFSMVDIIQLSSEDFNRRIGK